jgi:hypothetical protein
MFGHGQVEGFAEKYGMEFRRPRWDEQPDAHLIERHEREIAPLLHMRYLFTGVEHFWLYDFFTPEGNVNEEVYAYSNCYTPPGSEQAERGLIVYHNKFADTRGWIRLSAATLVKSPDGSQRLEQKTLGEGLMLNNADGLFTLFRDQLTGLEYIRSNRELHEKGLYLELNAYQRHVFLNFRELPDPQGHYARLAAYLNGHGVPSINEALDQLLLQPIQQPFREMVSADHLRWLLAEPADKVRLKTTEQQLHKLFHAAQDLAGGTADVAPVILAINARFTQVLTPVFENTPSVDNAPEIAQPHSANALYTPALPEDLATRATKIIWLCVSELGKVCGKEDFEQHSRSWIDEWQLGKAITEALHGLGLDDQEAAQRLALIKLLTMHDHWYTLLDADEAQAPQTRRVLNTLLADPDVQTYLHVNRYHDVLWFNKECFDQLLNWLIWLADLQPADVDTLPPYSSTHIVDALRLAEAQSDYQVEKLLAALPTP